MMNFRNVLIGLAVSALVAGIIVACGGGSGGGSSNPPAAPPVIRSASLDGTQAGTGATGTGRGAVVVDPATRRITGGITFTGLTGNPTAAHIHRADTSIAVGLQLASDNATGVLLNNLTLSAADYAELLAGTLYFNVHTVANSGGEIRGQINIQGGVVAGTAPLDNMQEVPASTSPATGRGTVVVDTATRAVLIAYIAHTVSGANAAHIHTSPSGPGSNGVVILGFPNLQTNVDGAGTNLAYPAAGSSMTTQNMTDFFANYLYFNVHSNVASNYCAPAVNCAAGEIRGNITALQ
jgi:CHRD domain-containing protein